MTGFFAFPARLRAFARFLFAGFAFSGLNTLKTMSTQSQSISEIDFSPGFAFAAEPVLRAAPDAFRFAIIFVTQAAY